MLDVHEKFFFAYEDGEGPITCYRGIENRIERVLADAFDLKFPWPTEVKTADNRLLATERRDLLGVYREWNFRGEPLPEKIVPWPPRVAKDRFLEIFYGIGT